MRQLASLVIAASLAIAPSALAGDEAEDHENWLKTDDNLDLGDLQVEAGNVIAQEEHVVFKAKMLNQTSDWLFVKKHELEFTIDGNWAPIGMEDAQLNTDSIVEWRPV